MVSGRSCFSWSKVTSLAKFGVALLGSNLVGYANRNADALLVGRFLGSAPLGVYSMAMQLMLYPLQHVSSVFVRVLFPTLAQIRDDLPRVRAAYLRAVGAICVITFPMMVGCSQWRTILSPLFLAPAGASSRRCSRSSRG
jgi:PST family polysaccharide transporter